MTQLTSITRWLLRLRQTTLTIRLTLLGRNAGYTPDLSLQLLWGHSTRSGAAVCAGRNGAGRSAV